MLLVPRNDRTWGGCVGRYLSSAGDGGTGYLPSHIPNQVASE